jgi:outer membrane biosynthesis protein TonB
MSQLVRAKHPKIILGVVGAALAVPVLGITISLAGVNANTPQDVSMQEVSVQDVSMEESAQNEVSAQHETVPTVAAGVAESQPAQSPLPDPLAPEPSRDSSPESEMTAEPKKTAEAETATPTPTSESKATKTPEPPVMNEPKVVKKNNRSSWWVDSPRINSRNSHAARAPTHQWAESHTHRGVLPQRQLCD